MNTLKRLLLAAVELATKAGWVPHTIVAAVRQRRRRGVHLELEAERLDRLRNPSKYLGKS